VAVEAVVVVAAAAVVVVAAVAAGGDAVATARVAIGSARATGSSRT